MFSKEEQWRLDDGSGSLFFLSFLVVFKVKQNPSWSEEHRTYDDGDTSCLLLQNANGTKLHMDLTNGKKAKIDWNNKHLTMWK